MYLVTRRKFAFFTLSPCTIVKLFRLAYFKVCFILFTDISIRSQETLLLVNKYVKLKIY